MNANHRAIAGLVVYGAYAVMLLDVVLLAVTCSGRAPQQDGADWEMAVRRAANRARQVVQVPATSEACRSVQRRPDEQQSRVGSCSEHPDLPGCMVILVGEGLRSDDPTLYENVDATVYGVDDIERLACNLDIIEEAFGSPELAERAWKDEAVEIRSKLPVWREKLRKRSAIVDSTGPLLRPNWRD
jgi:hypothetical protein